MSLIKLRADFAWRKKKINIFYPLVLESEQYWGGKNFVTATVDEFTL